MIDGTFPKGWTCKRLMWLPRVGKPLSEKFSYRRLQCQHGSGKDDAKCRTCTLHPNVTTVMSLILIPKRYAQKMIRATSSRVFRGFRTASDEDAYAVAGMMPIEILANEMAPMKMPKGGLSGNDEEGVWRRH